MSSSPPIWLLEITENQKLNEGVFQIARRSLSFLDTKPTLKWVYVVSRIPFLNIQQKVTDVKPEPLSIYVSSMRRVLTGSIQRIDESLKDSELHIELNNDRGKGLLKSIAKFKASKIYITVGRPILGGLGYTCGYLSRKRPKSCAFVAIDKFNLKMMVNYSGVEVEFATPEVTDVTNSSVISDTSELSDISSTLLIQDSSRTISQDTASETARKFDIRHDSFLEEIFESDTDFGSNSSARHSPQTSEASSSISSPYCNSTKDVYSTCYSNPDIPSIPSSKIPKSDQSEKIQPFKGVSNQSKILNVSEISNILAENINHSLQFAIQQRKVDLMKEISYLENEIAQIKSRIHCKVEQAD